MNLAITVPLNTFVKLMHELGILEYKNFIKHSFQVAKLSKQIAQNINLDYEPEQIYLAGLLHDFGLVLKASVENYELFKDIFRNTPDIEKVVLALDKKDQHSLLSNLVTSKIQFVNPDCSKALLYHHMSGNEIGESKKIALLANCIKAADTISLANMRKKRDELSAESMEEMVNAIEKDRGLFEEVKKASLEIIHDYTKIFDLLDEQDDFSSSKQLSLKDFETGAKLIATLMDLRSPYTRSHTFLVTRVAKQLTAELMSEEDSRFMTVAALLHDIGKISTPLEILHKKSSLNDKELLIMRRHAVETHRMLSRAGIKAVADVSASHHERLDGSGYPVGLKSNETTIYMRILQVSDVFSALVEKRPYRDAVSLNEAIEILEKEASFKKLDSQVCKKLKELINNGYLDEFFTNRFTHVLEDLFELKFNEIDTIFERDFDGWEGLF